MLHTRDEEPQCCYDHIASIESNNRKCVKMVHRNNAKELYSMRKALKRMGIKLSTISAHSPEPSSVAERVDRKLLD